MRTNTDDTHSDDNYAPPAHFEHVSGAPGDTVALADIDLFQCLPDATLVHCRDGRRLVLQSERMISWLHSNYPGFVQLSRKLLMRVEACTQLYDAGAGGVSVLLRCGARYPVKRSSLVELTSAVMVHWCPPVTRHA